MANTSFTDSFNEVLGIKTGLAVGRPRQLTMLKDFDSNLSEQLSDAEGGGRMSSTTYEEVVAYFLYRLGHLDSPRVGAPAADVYHRYKNDPERGSLTNPVGDLFVSHLGDQRIDTQARMDEATAAFITEVFAQHGSAGADVAMAYLKATARSLHIRPWGLLTQRSWSDQRDLEELFTSEKLDSQYGRFFDQRFLNYLARNFDDIDKMNWRQFEGLVGEYFDREGFAVEMGPGRNDNGIDLRVSSPNGRENPPLMIVQCKRQKAKIDKVIIKSVYADVIDEKAESGLIVTTSTLSPGAEQIRVARDYPIEAVERQKLKEWIDGMKTEAL